MGTPGSRKIQKFGLWPGTLGLGTPRRLWVWALQQFLGWALRDTLGMGDFGVGQSRETLGGGGGGGECLKLGTPINSGLLQGVSRSRQGEEKSSGRGGELPHTEDGAICCLGGGMFCRGFLRTHP